MSIFVKNQENSQIVRRSSRLLANVNSQPTTSAMPSVNENSAESRSRMSVAAANTGSSDILQHQHIDDLGDRPNSIPGLSHSADQIICTENIEVMHPTASEKSRRSHQTSLKSNASSNRRRLEVQLQFIRRKQEQELQQMKLNQQNELLQLEEAVELAKIDDHLTNSSNGSQNEDDIFVSFDTVNHNSLEHVTQWVEASRQIQSDVNKSHPLPPIYDGSANINQLMSHSATPVQLIDTQPPECNGGYNSNHLSYDNFHSQHTYNNQPASLNHHSSNIHVDCPLQHDTHSLRNCDHSSIQPPVQQSLLRNGDSIHENQKQLSTQNHRHRFAETIQHQNITPGHVGQRVDINQRSPTGHYLQGQQHHQLFHQPHQLPQQHQYQHVLPPLCNQSTQLRQSNDHSRSRLNNIEGWITRQAVNRDLPKFSGNPLEWVQFITQYESTTRICNLSNVENQNRLLKSLGGSALSVVQPLLIYPHNVDRVIEILRNRFGRNEYIIHLLLDKVRNFSVIKDDKINSLISFFDSFSNLVYTLESLNEWDHIRNPILFSEILNKLPLTQQIDFNQYLESSNSKEPKILELHKWLERRVNAASKIIDHSVIAKFATDDKSNPKNNKPKALTFAINDTLKSESSNYSCFYCKISDHGIYSCTSFKKLDIDKRWDFIKSNKACISCLRPKHSIKQCKKRKKCAVSGCNYYHNILLHNSSNSKSSPVTESKVESSSETNCHVHNNEQYSLLKIVPVTLKGPKSSIDTFAMLDDGSTVTLIDSQIATMLGLNGPTKHLRLQWTNDQFNEQKDSQIVSVEIKGRNSNKFYTLRKAKTISDLNLPLQSVDMDKICEKYTYLNSFKYLSYDNAKPMVIIGQDNWPIVVSRKVTRGSWNGPTVSKTLLGWVLHGNISNSCDIQTNSLFHIYDSKPNFDEKDDLNVIQDMIKKQWSFDIDGATVDFETEPSLDDKRCIEILNSTVKRIDGRFESGIFWKSQSIELPESKIMALKRLELLEKKMDKDSGYAKAYEDKIEDYVSKGYVKKLSRSEASVETVKTWYLPHFGVINPNKPGKLRIVFDAAARSGGYSLNDFLLTGPDLYNSLPKILMNFRIKRFAFIGDIREMFLQIKVIEQDRHAQRFLWRGQNRTSEPEVYEIQVIFFGAKCSPSIAQEIKLRNARDFISDYPEACNEIEQNHYMDDFLGGAESEGEAIQLIKDIIFVHEKGGFDMVNWISNSVNIQDSIDENKKTPQNHLLDEHSSEERVLGMWWDFREDVFKYRMKFEKIDPEILGYGRRPTKREILKILMSIFDPLGFLSNLVIVGKILMQNIWETGLAWDDQINDNQYVIWKDWSANFKNAVHFRVPRLLTTLDKYSSNIDMHVFCDASKHAYAIVVYLRFQKGDQIQCVLINSKARVAPLKLISIPRLELLAALLGSRVSFNIKKTLNLTIQNIILWTDSATVLSWIKSSSKRFKTFVGHRIGEIHDLTEPTWWKYIPSKLNIADDATKNKPIDFSPNSIWLNGPEFLYKPKEEWPDGQFELKSIDETECVTEHFLLILERIDPSVLPDIKRFSKWNRFIRSVAWVIKYIEKLRSRSRSLPLPYDTFELLPDDIAKAEKIVFRKVQQDSYSNELTSLLNKQELSKRSSLSSFSCHLNEDNLICVSGRLNKSREISQLSKQPIILDSKHDITKLLVRFYHEQNNHIGTEKIISDIRTRFWITNVRSLVKRVKYDCQYCKNSKARPEIPVMGQLPSCRVDTPIRPFMKCGVDYFGPIEVTVNRHHEKRYGVIFTCMAIRAIHIEIAQDLSCNSFMHVLIQFGNRRGFPDELFSDNGSNFKKANIEIQNALRSWPQEEVVKFCTTRRCKWTFNPPLAPHMGGAWERMIQSVKKHLYSILHTRYPREFVLRTLLSEVESIINNRPITYNSIDPNDESPLTPNNFLIGLQSQSYPFKKTDDNDTLPLSMWTASQRMADVFWKRWVSEYLPTILLPGKWKKESKNVAVNDIVLVVDPDNPRNVWPKGIIQQTYPAADGCVRIVDVKTTSGIYRRPVTKIIKLDIFNKSNSPS